jgi:hypothetical protein|tara:strand:- start:3379 stop:3699 length:321 start_codon:yes stop_codon:yes gene_type:complete
MASGILGQSALAATTNTTVYTVPANTHSVVNVNVLNRSATAPALVRLALASTGTPTNAEWIEHDVSIPKNGVLERTALSLQAARNIVAYSSTGDVTVTIFGIEQAV